MRCKARNVNYSAGFRFDVLSSVLNVQRPFFDDEGFIHEAMIVESRSNGVRLERDFVYAQLIVGERARHLQGDRCSFNPEHLPFVRFENDSLVFQWVFEIRISLRWKFRESKVDRLTE